MTLHSNYIIHLLHSVGTFLKNVLSKLLSHMRQDRGSMEVGLFAFLFSAVFKTINYTLSKYINDTGREDNNDEDRFFSMRRLLTSFAGFMAGLTIALVGPEGNTSHGFSL